MGASKWRCLGPWGGGPMLLLLLLLSLVVLLEAELTPTPGVYKPGCSWCSGMPDGYHIHKTTDHSCSRFFRCYKQQLAEVGLCPTGLCYDSEFGGCVLESFSQHKKITNDKLSSRRPSRKVLQLYRRLGHGISHVREATSTISSKGAEENKEWDQVKALLVFRASNRDPSSRLANWTVPPGWPHSESPSFVCKWKGVKCSRGSKGGPVSISRLTVIGDPESDKYGRNSLWGLGQSIPPQFSSLTGLEALDLSYNGVDGTLKNRYGGLTGSIPTELCLCTKLTNLSLQYNALTGAIPDCISQLSQLQALTLHMNLLSGTLTSSLSLLTNLTLLTLSSNNFSGNIPTYLSALHSISELTFDSLPLSGPIPSQIGAMPNLTQLVFNVLPYLTGPLVSSLSQLNNLQYLRVTNTPLTGTVADWLGRMPSLVSLILQNTNVSGPLPSSLGNSTSLDTLVISGGNMSGAIPSTLFESCSGDVPSLSQLDLSGNAFTGGIPLALSKCTTISRLDLSDNQLAGPFPPLELFQQVKFTNVLLGGNKLNGSISDKIFKVSPDIIDFNVSSNLLSGSLPKFDCGSSRGRTLSLQDNLFTGDIAPFLQNIGKCDILTVDLSRNRLQGPLPASFLNSSTELNIRADGNNISGILTAPTNCSRLQTVSLSNNNLSGAIPWELITRCPNLTLLDLGGNNLYGSMPSALQNGKTASGKIAPLKVLNLQESNLSGGLPTWMSLLNDLQALNLSNNKLSGSLPLELSRILHLSSLDLSSNSLSGTIPPQLAPPNFKNMLLLNLSWNEFTGAIPYSFGNFTNQTHALDLSHNNLTGAVPPGSLSSSPESVANNSFLCGGAGYDPCPSLSSDSSSISTGAIVGLSVASAVALLLIGVAAWWWFLRPTDEWSRGTMLAFRQMDPPLTIQSILETTHHFSDEHILGRGGFGSVYKATFPSGVEVAVKRLSFESSSQGNDEFMAELKTLGALVHKNLVVLLGAYIGAHPSKERLLVYQFLPGGSLDKLLTEEMPLESPLRRWEVRLKILTEVARALKYLHMECETPIIHRDMKPSNIMLDEHMVAKVTDFGLASEIQSGLTSMTAAVAGTAGFLAPEYAFRNRLSFKSDVYAFGVTMLQIVSGRGPTEARIVEEGLSRWFGARGVREMVDPNLDVEEDKLNQVLGTIHLALKCVQRIPADRPQMDEVLHTLQNMETFAQGIRTDIEGPLGQTS